MAHAPLPLYRRGFGETMRRDAWWIQPLVVFTLLLSFVVYATWAATRSRFRIIENKCLLWRDLLCRVEAFPNKDRINS